MTFWRTKPLSAMTTDEWESLCDGCGKCCLHKIEDEDTGDVYFTRIACRLIDLSTCRCTHYSERTQHIPDCVDIRQLDTDYYYWLPATCAYRLIHEGKDLPRWHPLISKNTTSVENARVSIRCYARTECSSDNLSDLQDFILDWLE